MGLWPLKQGTGPYDPPGDPGVTAGDLAPEAELLVRVVELARLEGWLVYHSGNSRWIQPGFPDLVLVRALRVLCVEIKPPKGGLTKRPKAWLKELGECPVVETYLWRPADWDALREILGVRA